MYVSSTRHESFVVLRWDRHRFSSSGASCCTRAVDHGVIDVQASLEHHLLQVAVAKRIPQIPADTQQNNLGLEVTPFECDGGMHEIGSSQFSEYRRVYRILAFFATEPLKLYHWSPSKEQTFYLIGQITPCKELVTEHVLSSGDIPTS